jgi:hypothetical protein
VGKHYTMEIPKDENDRSSLGVIQDGNVQIKLGTCYNTHLKDPDSILKSKWDGKQLLSIGEVKELWKEIHGAESLHEMESTPRKKVYLHELLIDSELLLPKLEIPKRSPALEQRITALRNLLAEKEYQRMTKNVNFSSKHNPEDSIGYQSEFIFNIEMTNDFFYKDSLFPF